MLGLFTVSCLSMGASALTAETSYFPVFVQANALSGFQSLKKTTASAVKINLPIHYDVNSLNDVWAIIKGNHNIERVYLDSQSPSVRAAVFDSYVSGVAQGTITVASTFPFTRLSQDVLPAYGIAGTIHVNSAGYRTISFDSKNVLRELSAAHVSIKAIARLASRFGKSPSSLAREVIDTQKMADKKLNGNTENFVENLTLDSSDHRLVQDVLSSVKHQKVNVGLQFESRGLSAENINSAVATLGSGVIISIGFSERNAFASRSWYGALDLAEKASSNLLAYRNTVALSDSQFGQQLATLKKATKLQHLAVNPATPRQASQLKDYFDNGTGRLVSVAVGLPVGLSNASAGGVMTAAANSVKPRGDVVFIRKSAAKYSSVLHEIAKKHPGKHISTADTWKQYLHYIESPFYCATERTCPADRYIANKILHENSSIANMRASSRDPYFQARIATAEDFSKDSQLKAGDVTDGQTIYRLRSLETSVNTLSDSAKSEDN